MNCPMCGTPSILDVDNEMGERIVKWHDDPSPHKPHIQDAFPELSPAQRELLITGTHEKCWDDLFGKED